MLRHARYARLIVAAGLVCGWLFPVIGADKSEKPGDPKGSEAKSEPSVPAPLSRDEDYELFSVLVDTLDQVERNYVKDISRRELVEAAIQGVLSKLDPYSNYISPGDLTKFRTSVESQFGGIGIQINAAEGQITVVTPLVGTPAYRAGLQAGDRIVEINGEPTAGISTEKAVERLKGEVGSEVTLKVLAAGSDEPRTVTVAREVVHIETVLGDARKGDDHWDFMLDREKKIGYIRITGFSRDTAGDLRDALAELKNEGLKALVLDLRFNPGGLLNSAIEVSDLFISEGRIVSTEGRNTEPRFWDAHAPGTFDGFPMVVLVNRYSASASEIVAACLQDHGRALIVGERTWGKGSVQNVIEMEGGKSALKLTTASYKRPNGKNIHRFPDASEADEWGVKPNDGYDARLSNSELRELIEGRHDRDIVKRRTTTAIAAAIAGAKSARPAEKKPDSPDANNAPAGSDSTTVDKPESKPAPINPIGDGQVPTTGKSSEAKAKRSEPSRYSDRQMEKAIEYLSTELAKGK